MAVLLVVSVVIMAGLTCYILGFLHGLPSCLTAKDFAIGERFKLLRLESVYHFGGLFCRHIAVVQGSAERVFIVEGDSFLWGKVGDEFEVSTFEKWLKSDPASDKDSVAQLDN